MGIALKGINGYRNSNEGHAFEAQIEQRVEGGQQFAQQAPVMQSKYSAPKL